MWIHLLNVIRLFAQLIGSTVTLGIHFIAIIKFHGTFYSVEFFQKQPKKNDRKFYTNLILNGSLCKYNNSVLNIGKSTKVSSGCDTAVAVTQAK